MVYTVCNSLCVFWMLYSKEKPSCSTFRVITANFRVSEILGFLRYIKLEMNEKPGDLIKLTKIKSPTWLGLLVECLWSEWRCPSATGAKLFFFIFAKTNVLCVFFLAFCYIPSSFSPFFASRATTKDTFQNFNKRLCDHRLPQKWRPEIFRKSSWKPVLSICLNTLILI